MPCKAKIDVQSGAVYSAACMGLKSFSFQIHPVDFIKYQQIYLVNIFSFYNFDSNL